MYITAISKSPNLIKYPIIMISKPDSYLLSSVLLETLSTFCLKKTLTNKIWYLPVYLGYGISFYIFPKSFTKYSLSTAYIIWCGLGIVLTTGLDILIYKEVLNIKKLLSIILILTGIKINK
tara:strand:+ start:759 stop:1121 length:363 start_codon:yes stop_codon:yes gene_type:complete